MEEIGGIKHPAFREALALTKQSERQATGLYLVEAANLARQALVSPSEVRCVFATPDEAAELKPLCAARGVSLYIMRSSLMSKLIATGYETAVTAVAVVRQRTIAEADLTLDAAALYLAGEQIQDPRNVGVLIRTAEAAGCGALLLSADSAEPFSRAAVRSTTGSILRLPLCLCPNLPATLARLRERGGRVIATSARASHAAYDADLAVRPLIIAVGNESSGLTDAAREAAADFVSLPIAPDGPSSLNVTVAAGVLLYEAIRQKR